MLVKKAATPQRVDHKTARIAEHGPDLRMVIRECDESDLDMLDACRVSNLDREVIEATFQAAQRGEAVMLVAEVNGTPIGQVWLDLARKSLDNAGLLWALRVVPYLRNLGIGTKLIRAAERTLRNLGFVQIDLTVEKANYPARRLYRRLGYILVPAPYISEGPHGRVAVKVPSGQLLMRKPLC